MTKVCTRIYFCYGYERTNLETNFAKEDISQMFPYQAIYLQNPMRHMFETMNLPILKEDREFVKGKDVRFIVCPDQESNLDLILRTDSLYPLSYWGGVYDVNTIAVGFSSEGYSKQIRVDLRRLELLTSSMPWRRSTN